MKTTVFSLVISIFLVLAGVNTLNAGNRPGGNTAQEVKPLPVAYVIHIDNRNNFTGNNQFYQIAMTDETGRLVAPPQRFRKGEWYYTFYEQGPVRGTRVARMIRQPLRPGSYSIRPCTQTGVFEGNTCYLFNIIPYLDAVPAGFDVP